MKKPIKLQRAMIVNNRFGYAVLERHTGLSRSFVRKKIQEYEAAGFIDRAGLGKNQEKLWRLTQEGRRQFDPQAPKQPVINQLDGGQLDTGRHIHEQRIWTAIRELKTFSFKELADLKLANVTTVRTYVALLRRAGILTGKRVKSTKSKLGAPIIYTLVPDAGSLTPLMGRSFYIFDPNTGEYFSTPMERFKIK